MADAHDQDLTARTGSNLYPATMRQQFGELSLELDVPEGMEPTPHGIHLGNMLMKLDFSNEHVLKLAGCGIHFCWPSAALEKSPSPSSMPRPMPTPCTISKARRRDSIHQQVADWIHIEGASHQGGPWDTGDQLPRPRPASTTAGTSTTR